MTPRSTLILVLYALVFSLVHVVSLLYLIILSIPNDFVVKVGFNSIGEGWLEVGIMFFTLTIVLTALVKGFQMARKY